MKRLVIAIDCDDVLVPGTEHNVSTYNQLWGTNVTLANAHTLDNPEWEATEQEIRRRFDEFYLSEEYATVRPYQEAIEAVSRLALEHELHMVTARPETVMAGTERMVGKYFPDCFSSVRHVGLDGSKGEICEALKAGVIIDDNLRHLITAKDCGVSERIWFGDYPWQGKAEDSEGIARRARSWNEVEAEIARIAG